MSHEIRTPMNGVLGMTELVLATTLTTAQREYMGIIRDSGQALLTIIDDILDFSKIEAGRLVLDPVEFAPDHLVETATELLTTRACAKQIDLLTYLAPDVPTRLRGDVGRLRQVLLNLVGNAVKFTDEGEVSVRVSVETETAATVTLRFAVYDTGIGLSAAARERLFQPFTQADGSMARRYGGTGLGLAISKRLVELMGGAIEVSSVEGQGSRFWFTVPLQRVAESVEAVAPDGQDGRRILVVDSSRSTRAIVQSYLETWNLRGENVATAAEGLAALRDAAASGAPYALVLLDAALPDMSPVAFGRRLLEEPALAHTRFVLMRSLDTHDLDDATQLRGFGGTITKPIRQSQLCDAIMGALEPARATREPRQELRADPAPPSAPEAEASTEHETMILVAEDNLVNQKLTLLQLAKLGYRARAVANGREALVALGTEPYHLVLMDCQMPEMDGYQATAMIRNAEANGSRRVPILALTANAMPTDRAACLAAGMDDYLTKPLKLDELRARLAHWLSAHDAVPTPPDAVAAPLPEAISPGTSMPRRLAEFAQPVGLGPSTPTTR
jgi:two-component system sensor histidine kinase/response regulator